MKTLLVIKYQGFFPDAPLLDVATFGHRRAARAVLFDKDGRVFLLNVTKYGYHKLPGGGIDDGEDIRQALARELMEEVGATAEVMGELGQIIEYRDEWEEKQTSYCFVAKQTGELSASEFTELELDDGFEVTWSNSIDDAITLLESDQPENFDGKFIQRRDITFLRAAKEFLALDEQVESS